MSLMVMTTVMISCATKTETKEDSLLRLNNSTQKLMDRKDSLEGLYKKTNMEDSNQRVDIIVALKHTHDTINIYLDSLKSLKEINQK